MCSEKLFYHDTIFNRAGADLARCVQKCSTTKCGEGGDTEALRVTDQGSNLCPQECAGLGPYALPPCRRVTRMTTSVCPSVRPAPILPILPFPPAPLNTRSQPCPAGCRAPTGQLSPLQSRETKVLPPPPHPLGAVDRTSALEPLEMMERGEGLAPFLPSQLRSLHKQVILLPTQPTDSSGPSAQAVPSPLHIINNGTGPACQNNPLTMAG